MPEDLAGVIVDALSVVNMILDTWVDLGAPQPLTDYGSVLVSNLAQVAVTMANTMAFILSNNPI